MKEVRRVRKGPRGLYYTRGKLDNNYYNKRNVTLFRLILIGYESLPSELGEASVTIVERVKDIIEVIFYILLFPILPIIRAIRARLTYLKDVEVQRFPKDYYEILSYEREDDEDE